MWTLWGLAVHTIAGFFDAHAAASTAHEHRFGFIGQTITGLVEGVLSGALGSQRSSCLPILAITSFGGSAEKTSAEFNS
ncbi:hypothetical protein [Bradyrhizobium sp. Leo121]|uniref:hypothetical protein n=1 Tax=Bradyrhizobium sp. Leo121 TaxID=1571195 RepID=UPI00102962F6|nr:hypothetical protein [Bradyrhizobium sp. Leo121]RZN17432.1 hypothetical protein CWO90_37580 [Bradyrhizobium sp. Leo121]